MQKRISIGAPVLAATLTTSLLAVPAAASVRPDPTPADRSDAGSRSNGKYDPCSSPWLSWPAMQTTDPNAGRAVTPPPPPAKRTAATTESSQRPNIVTIMVDDMRADELSGPWMRHTRALIQDDGASFENSFSPSPVCGPARASFFSGKYAHNTGVRTNRGPSAFSRFDDANTLPVWLQDAGYNTAHLGKYLNGYGSDSPPGSDGSSPEEYVPPGWDKWYGSLGGSTYRYYNTKLSENGKGTIDLGGRYQTSAYGSIGSQLVSRMAAEREPFFLDLSFTAPHTGGPREPDDPKIATPARRPELRGAYNDRITQPRGRAGEPCNEDKPRVISDAPPLSPAKQAQVVSAARQRAESLATVDDSVRDVFAALRRSGELDNTYVVFTSDNGYYQGEFRQAFGKELPYEPALRTPTLVRGPGIKEGIVRSQPFTTIDFAPTIADMADARVRAKVDGISLLPSATGADRRWSRAILTDAGPQRGDNEYGYGVRMPGLAYHEFDDSRTSRELYDLKADPFENHNVVQDRRYRKVRETMERVLDRLRGCEGKECRQRW
ncbi:MAG: sulfatase-like hydrolase/transferase [Nocardioidaceae bacterium]